MLRAVQVRSCGDCQRLPFLGLLRLIAEQLNHLPSVPVLVPRNPICRYYSRVNTWLFLSKIFNETNKKHVQQPSGSTCHSGTTSAGCSHDQRQTSSFPKLSQESTRRRYSFNIDNDSSNIWAPLWKANKMEPIPHEVRCRQSPAQEQRDPQSYWIREQPCGDWEAERSQHFFKPVSPLPEKDTSLAEDFQQACPRTRVQLHK